jgi:aryl-alcohol dehydrogenase-like predicted oxidoreductase
MLIGKERVTCFIGELGKTGMQVSALGFGTVKLGRTEGVKYPQAFNIPDDNEARALLNLARDLGINLTRHRACLRQ